MNLSVQIEKNKKDEKDYDLYNSLNDPLLYDDEILNSLQELNEIQHNLSNLVASQKEKIDSIESNITKTESNTYEGLKELQEADKLFLSYKTIFIGGALGALVGGPVGAVIGVKWITLSGSIGTLLGSYGGYKIQKN